MRTSLVGLLVCLVISVVAAGSIFATAVAWVGDGLDVTSMAIEGERCYELDAALCRAHERREAMDLLIECLAAGTRSLAEAVPESAALQDDGGITIGHMRYAFGGQSDHEVLARHLLIRVASRLTKWPEQYSGVLPRLEAEFRELYPLASTLRVPEFDARRSS